MFIYYFQFGPLGPWPGEMYRPTMIRHCVQRYPIPLPLHVSPSIILSPLPSCFHKPPSSRIHDAYGDVNAGSSRTAHAHSVNKARKRQLCFGQRNNLLNGAIFNDLEQPQPSFLGHAII